MISRWYIAVALIIGSGANLQADTDSAVHPNPELFVQGAFSGPVTVEPCTLTSAETLTAFQRMTGTGATQCLEAVKRILLTIITGA